MFVLYTTLQPNLALQGDLALCCCSLLTQSFSLRTQVTISVTSSSGDDRLLEQEALQTLLDQLQLPLITSLKVEHHEEPKSSKSF